MGCTIRRKPPKTDDWLTTIDKAVSYDHFRRTGRATRIMQVDVSMLFAFSMATSFWIKPVDDTADESLSVPRRIHAESSQMYQLIHNPLAKSAANGQNSTRFGQQSSQIEREREKGRTPSRGQFPPRGIPNFLKIVDALLHLSRKLIGSSLTVEYDR